MLIEAKIIRHLEEVYVPMFQKLFRESYEEAKASFDGLIEKAKTVSQQKKFSDINANSLLNLAKTNPKIGAELDWKTQEGVREEDFRWWWDMPDLERQLLILIDFIHGGGYYGALRDQGIPEKVGISLHRQSN